MKQTAKRFLSLFLVMVLVFAAVPTMAFADEADPVEYTWTVLFRGNDRPYKTVKDAFLCVENDEEALTEKVKTVVPEGHEFVKITEIDTDKHQVTAEVKKAEAKAAREILIHFVDMDGEPVTETTQKVGADRLTISVTAPEGYVIFDSNNVFPLEDDTTEITVTVSKCASEPETPDFRWVRVDYVTESGLGIGMENVKVSLGAVNLTADQLKRIPEGYHLLDPAFSYDIAADDRQVQVVVVKDEEPADPAPDTKPDTKPVLNKADHFAYIEGYEDGTFRPQGEITRAEAVTIFYRLMSKSSRERYWDDVSEFRDVPQDAWYTTAVATMDNAGIIVDSKENFRPNEPITRAELAVMAAQFTGKTYSGAASFSDVSSKHWAADEIAMVEHMGWIEGYPDGTFRPEATLTRAEAVAVFNRMCERAVDPEGMLPRMVTFPDVRTSDWFYEDVQEAANDHEYVRTEDQVPGEPYCYEMWTKLY